MKKTFLAMCMVAMGFLAVSCYDDSRLWDEVESLGDRVEKLEKDLQADVENLNALQNKVNSLETSLTEAIAAGDKAVKDALEKKLTDLETKLTAAQQAGDNAIIAELLKEKETLTGALTALQEGLTGVTTSVAKLDAALKTLEATVGKNHTDLLTELDKVDGKVDGHITDMAAALATLKDEATKAIADAIAKIAVTKVETVDGKIVLTLADGSTVAVSAPLANVENTGLVTVVEVEGVKYWAVVEADGTVKNLDVVVGHPDYKIDFQINANGELEYRVNGGEWNNTGLKAAAEDANSAILTDFVDGEDYVEIVINGTKVVLPKYVADEASFEFASSSYFIRYTATREVALFAEGISEFYVMAKPNGWKAKLEEDVLVLTAPTKAAVEIGAAEVEGEVLIHATANNGACKVYTLEVSTGKGLTVEVSNGVLTMKNAYAKESFSHWGDPMGVTFTDFYVGVVPAEEFVGAEKEFFAYLNENYEAPSGYSGMWYNNYNYEHKEFVEGEYEIDVINDSITNLYKWLAWDDNDGMDYGSPYVIWVAPVDDEGRAIIDAVEFVNYTLIQTDNEVSDITYNNATLSLTLKGADKYFVGAMPDPTPYGYTIEQYMAESAPWSYMVNGYADYIEMYLLDGEYTGEDAFKMSDLLGEKLAFGTKYYYWVVPYQEGVVYSDYKTQFEPYLFTFETAPLQAGGTHAAAYSDEVIGYKTIDVTVTPSEGTDMVYYYFFDAETWAEMEEAGEDVVRETLFSECYYPLEEADVVSESYLTPGVTYVLASVSVGTDGKYGEIVTASYTTLNYPSEVNEAHTAVFGEPVIDFTSISVNVTPAEGTTVYYRWIPESNLAYYPTEAELVAYVMSGSKINAASDVKVTNLSAGTERYLVAVVVGADNKYRMYKSLYTTTSLPYSEDITVVVESCEAVDGGKYKAVINVTGATKVVAKAYYSGSTAANIIDLAAVQYGADKSNTDYLYADVVDGKATIEFTPKYYCYTLYVTAYNVAEDKVSAIAKTSVAHTFAK